MAARRTAAGRNFVRLSLFPIEYGDPIPATSATEFQVVVPHTSPERTRAALRRAAALIGDLQGRIRLLDVHVVPFGLPLDKPAVSPAHLTARLRTLAEASALPVAADIVYARDWQQGFERALTPRSVVLMPIKNAWWRIGLKRFASRLRSLGHEVIW